MVQTSTLKTPWLAHTAVPLWVTVSVALSARLALAHMVEVTSVAHGVRASITGSSGLVCGSCWLGGCKVSDGIDGSLEGTSITP
jgi:hypothetical protein